jgi:hypothetical protein
MISHQLLPRQIKTGMYSGRTSSEIKTPLPRNPGSKPPQSADQTQHGVPSNNVTKGRARSLVKIKLHAKRGAIKTGGISATSH